MTVRLTLNAEEVARIVLDWLQSRSEVSGLIGDEETIHFSVVELNGRTTFDGATIVLTEEVEP